MIKSFKAMFLAASLGAAIPSMSFAQVRGVRPLGPRSIVTDVHVVADPIDYRGQCPATITFTGTISVNRPGTVLYYWLRSDGGHGPKLSLRFEKAGEQTVTTTWRIRRNYHGWEAIVITTGRAPRSSRAAFDIRCEK